MGADVGVNIGKNNYGKNNTQITGKTIISTKQQTACRCACEREEASDIAVKALHSCLCPVIQQHQLLSSP